MTFSLVGWVGYLIIVAMSYHNTPHIQANPNQALPKNPPLVSIVIPARNESKRIRNCITTLKSQTYPKLEFIIIDDSTDDTIEVIHSIVGDDQRFKIIRQEKLPPGWIGKPFALQQGSTVAQGSYLIFIDADTTYDPVLIEKAIGYTLDNKLDMLSLAPRHICVSFWEKMIQPIFLCAILGLSPLAQVNDARSKTSFASGPFIMVKHSVFDAVGGYQTIKGCIADDIELAKVIKNSGYKLAVVHAQSLMSLRMYQKFSDIWEGWSKNCFLGFVQKREMKSKALQVLLFLGVLFLIFMFLIFPFLSLIGGIVLLLFFHSITWVPFIIYTLATWIVSVLTMMYVLHIYRIDSPSYVPLTLILGGIVTMGIFTNAALRTIFGKGVTWKGRTYPIEQ
jgi:chlorobactene glucosyltransferase